MSITPEEKAEIIAAVRAELEGPVVSPAGDLGGFFPVQPGQTIMADHMNLAIENGVPKFANASARDAQWPSPPIGAMCYLIDLNYLQVYDNVITGGAPYWRILGTLRMGYSTMGDNQVIATSTDTLVKRDTVGGVANRPGRGVWNADGSVTLPVSGTYLVSGNVTWPANATGERRLYVQRYANSISDWTYTGVAGGTSEVNSAATSSALRQSVSALVALVAGDKVGLRVRHSAGTSLTLYGPGTEQSRLAVMLMGAD